MSFGPGYLGLYLLDFGQTILVNLIWTWTCKLHKRGVSLPQCFLAVQYGLMADVYVDLCLIISFLTLQMGDIDGENWDGADAVATDTIPVAQAPELPEIKLFGRWSCDDVQVSDMSLQVSFKYFQGVLFYLGLFVLTVAFKMCWTNDLLSKSGHRPIPVGFR